MAAFTGYVAAVEGQYIDIDRAFGAQCWDLAAHYATWLYGPAGRAAMDTTDGPGDADYQYASALIRHYAATAERGDLFTLVSREATAQAGDLAVWARSPAYPGSHVAIVIRDEGSRLLTLSQNPGPAQQLRIGKAYLLGYLRPRRTASTLPIPSLTKDSIEMFLIHVAGSTDPFQVIHTATLKPVETIPVDAKINGEPAANVYARRFGNSVPMTRAQYDYYVTGKAAAKAAA